MRISRRNALRKMVAGAATVAIPSLTEVSLGVVRASAVALAKDYSHDLEAMLAHIDAAAGLVYICNPNNPTGTLTRRQDIEGFIRSVPATTHILIDEAYHHYVTPSSDYASFIDRPVDDDRVIVARSFSQVYGLAGLR